MDPDRAQQPAATQPALYLRPDYSDFRKRLERAGWSRKKRVAMFLGRTSWRGMRIGVRTGFRYRNKLWPLFTAGGMFMTSLALNLLTTPEDGGPDALGDGWKTALVLSVLAGIVLGWKQYTAWKRAEQWLRRSLLVSWVVWAASSAWTTVASALNPFTAPLPGMLIVAALGLEAWWFIHQSMRENEHEIEQDLNDWPNKILDQRIEQWVTNISRDGGALPGAELVGVDDLDDGLGWTADIRLPLDDAQTWENAVAAQRRIAKAYKVPATQVVVEPPLDGLEDTARLLVLTENPLMRPRRFEKPTLNVDTGQFEIGVHADGKSALWRLWTPGSGVHHGMVAGTTGAGKSGLLMNICAEIRDSGRALLLLADPENGESVRDWQLGAHCFAGTIPRIRRMLQGAERIMHARKRRRSKEVWVDENGNTRRGRGYFDPTPEDPAVYVVIDEAPDVLADPECKRIIASIGKKGRKHGVGVIIFIQIPSLAELGGDLAVRSMLSSTNIVIFRTSDTLSAQMGVPMKLPIDPANLPTQFADGSTTAGLGYQASAGGRVSPMRAAYQDNPHYWATSGQPALIPAPDYAAMTDQYGNMFDQWRELLDVDEDDEAEAEQAVAETYNVQVPEGSKERIIALLAQRLANGEPGVRTGVIATELSLTKPAVCTALRRLTNDSTPLVQQLRHGVWGLVQHDKATDDALVGATA